jgi:hypothetical protein
MGREPDKEDDSLLPDGLFTSVNTKGRVQYMAYCRGCDKRYKIFCSPADFSQDMPYCGGSPSCCP